MIEVTDLSKRFIRTEKKGRKEEFFAVDGVSFSAKSGEILGILGPNGAGKTTLLRMLGSLMEPTSGMVAIVDKDGEVITDKGKRKQHIGYLSENTKLYGRFTVREMLSVFGQLYGFSKERIEERINLVEDVLQMEGFMDNRIEKLSTGQKQRTSIARCLIHDPDVYIFDEPTLGLDVISSKAIIDFMKEEKKRGKCVLYSTHYMEEADALCDRILMMNEGKVIAEGTPKELRIQTNTDNLRDTFFAYMEGGVKDEL